MLYRSLIRPLLFRLPPETAHDFALKSLSIAPGVVRTLSRTTSAPQLRLNSFGLTFPNPVGLAAGFDKDGIALQALGALGFGFIEAGTVTYHPQPGNPRPRLFRLPADKALINRAGFNNHGAQAFVERVSHHRPNCVLGVSIGKSKIVPFEEAIEDYVRCFETIYPVADYVAVNVSSPNTPGLRQLQQAELLDSLLASLQQRNRELAKDKQPLPLLVKFAPDMSDKELETSVQAVAQNKLAGIIATNTTVSRGGLLTPAAVVQSFGEGGLSGAPLRKIANRVIARLYHLTRGHLPLIGVGGIFSAEDAWEKICAGASLVQLYTGFIYQGPNIANEIVAGLDQIMTREGLTSLDQAIGSRAKEFNP
jgi:dihydroorotate dehydrogenase